jgi:GTP-binding protein
MAQLKGRPPTFVLLANRAEHMPESYRRYLINGLRESFDLPGVPIRLVVRKSSNPFAEGEDAGAPAERSKPRYAAKADAAKAGAAKAAAAKGEGAKAGEGGKPKPKPRPRAAFKPGPKPAHPGRVRAKPVGSAPKPRPKRPGR